MNTIEAKIGTTGGTLLALLVQMRAVDLLNTIIFAAIGASVSYTVSYLLKRLFRDKTDKA